MNRRSVVFGGMAVCLAASKLSAVAQAIPIERKIVLPLADTPIILRVVWNGPGPRFFHPHENETASYRVARYIVLRRGGSVLSLHHGGGRYINFAVAGKKYRCDPNRIFTAKGTQLTLGGAPQHICDMVDSFAAVVAANVRKDLSPHSVVIGVHNNTPGSYGVHSYTQGGDMGGDAAEVFVNAGSSADDFFLTTKQQLFEALKVRHYNVVLQKNPPLHNDGSFSVYCSQQNIPYVNVEAQDAHGALQARMLRDLIGILSSTAA